MGLSIATLLSQYHKVYAVDIVPVKDDMVNQRISPVQDKYIEKYLADIITNYDQIVVSMEHSLSSNNVKFNEELEKLVDKMF